MKQASFLFPITGNRPRVTSALCFRSNYTVLLIFVFSTTKLNAQFLLSEDTRKREQINSSLSAGQCWLIVTIWTLFPASFPVGLQPLLVSTNKVQSGFVQKWQKKSLLTRISEDKSSKQCLPPTKALWSARVRCFQQHQQLIPGTLDHEAQTCHLWLHANSSGQQKLHHKVALSKRATSM